MAVVKTKDVELSFLETSVLSGTAAIISKTASAPIERVKLMIQNQDEMIKQGHLDKPYTGMVDCTMRTFKYEDQAVKYKSSLDCARQIIRNEGPGSLMKGTFANILRGIAGAGVLAGFDKLKEIYVTYALPQKPLP